MSASVEEEYIETEFDQTCSDGVDTKTDIGISIAGTIKYYFKKWIVKS